MSANENFFLSNAEFSGRYVNRTPEDLYMDVPEDYDEETVVASLVEKGVLEKAGETRDGALLRMA